MARSFTEALDAQPVRPFQWMIAGVCMLVLVCDGIDLQLLGIVAPLVIESFGTDPSTFGIAAGAALVGFGLDMLDRLERTIDPSLLDVSFGLGDEAGRTGQPARSPRGGP